MIIKKITSGFVIQDFDTDTGKFVRQEFVASDDCQYEDEKGNEIEGDPLKEIHFPFDMVQPQK